MIDENIAKLLQGYLGNAPSAEAIAFNPEAVPFIEFSRFSATTRAPVNPFKSNGTDQQDTARSYKVLFDTNGDRQIDVPSGDAQSPSNMIVVTSVAVWTVIPATRQTTSSGQTQGPTEVIFGSWDSFNVK